MKKIYLSLFFLSIIGLGFWSAKEWHKFQKHRNATLSVPSLENELSKMKDLQEEPLCLIVEVSNSHGLDNCLSSIQTQQYLNFDLIFVAEALSEKRQLQIENFLNERRGSGELWTGARATLEEKLKAKIAMLPQATPVVWLKSHNWLANDFVFKLINYKRARDGFDLLLGQFIRYPTYRQGIEKRRVRTMVEKGAYPKNVPLEETLKVLTAGLIQRHPEIDFFSLSEKGTFKDLFESAKKKTTFCRFVLEVKNESGDEHPLIFNSIKKS